jgi:hypothetical protein
LAAGEVILHRQHKIRDDFIDPGGHRVIDLASNLGTDALLNLGTDSLLNLGTDALLHGCFQVGHLFQQSLVLPVLLRLPRLPSA